MKILVGCEFSGIVRDSFAAQGHDAWSCDILPTERPGQHIRGDVRNVLNDGWDLAIFHPPCTYLCNSGVRWLHSDPTRWACMEEAADFFLELWHAPIERIAIENPVMHGYAKARIGVSQAQSFQPWQFGHGEVKRTCLWLKGLPLLTPTNIVEGREARVHKASPGSNRWKERSRTFEGVGAAMASQWG